MDKKNLKINKNIFVKTMNLKYVNGNYFNWFGDKKIKKYISYKPKSILDLKNNVYHYLKSKRTKFFAIFYKKLHVGNIKIDNISFQKKSCTFGIMIGHRQFRNIGLGTISIQYIKNWALKNKIINIYLGVDKKNKPAIKLYKNNGFHIYKATKKSFKLKINLLNSKIILGGAQFESNYGIINNKKKVSFKIAKKILNTALNYNIDKIDLSENYNINISRYKILKNFKINTKISTEAVLNKNFLELKKKFKNYYLKGYKINTLFIHNGDKVFTKNGKKLLTYLKKLKREKLISKIGISIYNFKIINRLSKANSIDVIQLPYNIVDNRVEKYFKKLKKLNIQIHARSIFLQGCLLKKNTDNMKLNQITDLFSKFCKKKKINNLNACFSHVQRNLKIDNLIIGVKSEDELIKIMNIKDNNNKKLVFMASNKIKNYAINPHKW
jgi:aryl-alcohol dehydrogenase-like predicted oxidoreductase/RimJ/RimL family protein N-acetyltransferase